MTTTLNHDEFADEPDIVHNYDPHNIVYGSLGWTDGIDDDAIDLLVSAGVVYLHKTVSGVGFETRIYVSTQGKLPA